MSSEELTLNLLRNLDENKSQKTLAEELNVSVGKINYIIKALVDKGLIKTENFFSNKNKNQYKYLLTKKGINEKIELTEKFIIRKKSEYEQLQKELNLMKDKNNELH